MEVYETLPIVPLRDVVVFPHMMMPFVIGRPSSTRALEHALLKDKRIFLAAQHDASIDDPRPEDIYTMGCVANVGRPVVEVRSAMARETKGDRSQGEQCAEDETREKDGFHGAVWLVVYSSGGGVSTESTLAKRQKLRSSREIPRRGVAAPLRAPRPAACGSVGGNPFLRRLTISPRT